ncbi:MAG TPA: class I SAM-dependent methyltransferase [Thermodesulfovibrionales bacterium]|nr:class I SAM-dependent methyltransferase [Thermodesulfovibrionales bacterium]
MKKLLENILAKRESSSRSAVIDEHFVPQFGLDLNAYIEKGDVSGVHHLIRYIWALEVINDLQPVGNILDIACGSGYGSYLIAKHFPDVQVVGSDYDCLAIKNAAKRYFLPNLQYKIGDLTRWEETLGKTTFDCIVSFDTIEHVSHREIMMQSLVEHLQKNGALLLSTPCGSPTTNLHPDWEHHKIEYSATSLYDFLRRYFSTILRPDDNSLPRRNVFDCLDSKNIDYLLIMNPVLCRDPITITNPYRHA